MRDRDTRTVEEVLSDGYIDENVNEIRYVNDTGRWVFNTNGVWTEIAENEAFGHMKEFFKDLCKRGWTMPSKSVLQNVHFLVKIDKRMWLQSTDFDVDPYGVRTPLRIVRLAPYGHPCTPSYFMKTTGPLNGDGTAPLWNQVIDTITGGDKDLALYLQKAAGYSLSGDMSEQCFFILYGSGRNGKSTFTNTLRYVMGTYAHQAHSELLTKTSTGGAQPELASLKGSRLVLVSELERRSKLNIGLIKQITGGDAITARHLYSAPISFVPQCKLWIITNDKPKVQDVGDALWRRMKLIPFNAVIPKEGSDKHIEEKLKEESLGIFNWLVEGFNMWRSDGLPDAETITEATQSYRNESSSVKLYIEDMCCLDPEAKIASRDLFMSYRKWCDDTGYEPIEYLEFGKHLSTLGIEKHRTADKMLRKGIRIGTLSVAV